MAAYTVYNRTAHCTFARCLTTQNLITVLLDRPGFYAVWTIMCRDCARRPEIRERIREYA